MQCDTRLDLIEMSINSLIYTNILIVETEILCEQNKKNLIQIFINILIFYKNYSIKYIA